MGGKGGSLEQVFADEVLSLSLSLSLFMFILCVRMRERESARAQAEEGQRARETEDLKQAPHCRTEPDAGLDLTTL